MPRDPAITALTDCGLACMRATNGHGRRWAVARCVRQLVAQGTPAGIAERSALAMVAVAAKVAAASFSSLGVRGFVAWLADAGRATFFGWGVTHGNSMRLQGVRRHRVARAPSIVRVNQCEGLHASAR